MDGVSLLLADRLHRGYLLAIRLRIGVSTAGLYMSDLLLAARAQTAVF